MADNKNNTYEANGEEIFHISYTLRLDKRVFFKFYTTKYETVANRFRFFDARIPRTIALGKPYGIVCLAQDIKPPELDTSIATVFILKVKKPDWFDTSEEDFMQQHKVEAADAEAQMQQQDLYELMDQIVLDPLLSKTIGAQKGK